MLAGAAVLTVLVLALVWAGFRAPTARQPGPRFWTHGLGLGLSVGVIAAVLGAGLWLGVRLQPTPGVDVIEVEARASQWQWQFRQPGPDGMARTQGVLFIPAGRPVDVLIASDDVIHSFWVPQLGGKMDAIPGRVNRLRIEASRTGIFEGLCAEFCGIGHAGMRFEVVAYDPDAPPEFHDLPAETEPEG